MDRFFDRYPLFHETSLTGNDAEWNNRRHQVLIDGCRAHIAGKRIVDYGSHNGRWAFAALQAGAAHVTLVEPEEQLNAAARRCFQAYGVDERRYEIVETDASSHVLGDWSGKFDTAFLFGMLTLISEQPVLFGSLKRRGVASIILDTHIIPNETREIMQLITPRLQRGNSIIADRTSHNGAMIGMVPSLPSLLLMFRHFEWDAQILDWSELAQHPDMNDYKIGRRVSILAA